jgi:SM-20-related protein
MPRSAVFSSPDLLVREAFLDAATCGRIIDAMVADGGGAAEVTSTDGTMSVDQSIRHTREVALDDDHHDRIAVQVNRLLPELERWAGGALEPCDELSGLWYPPGAFYRPHVDARRVPDACGMHRRRVSIVIFLNGGPGDETRPFSGGRLRLYGLLDEERPADVGIDIEPERGTLVAFRSSIWHEVTPVESGNRFTVVTWLLAPG